MIESRATNLIRFFRKKTLALGPINWQEPDLQQDHLDLMYVPLNHDQMYDHYELIGADILYFLNTTASPVMPGEPGMNGTRSPKMNLGIKPDIPRIV